VKREILLFIRTGLTQRIVALGGGVDVEDEVEVVAEPANEMDAMKQYLEAYKSSTLQKADEEAAVAARMRRYHRRVIFDPSDDDISSKSDDHSPVPDDNLNNDDSQPELDSAGE
jgi:hypothetical protein